jgi:hypothetical protein
VRIVSTTSELVEGAFRWLQEHYNQFSFYQERDLVWTIQSYLVAEIRRRDLDLCVWNDYTLFREGRRAESADLALQAADRTIKVAIEFKFEPSHARGYPASEAPCGVLGLGRRRPRCRTRAALRCRGMGGGGVRNVPRRGFLLPAPRGARWQPVDRLAGEDPGRPQGRDPVVAVVGGGTVSIHRPDHPLADADWDALLTARRASVTDFLLWARQRERTPARSMRLENRDDLTRVQQVLPLFDEPWWGAVVYSCFDSIQGTRAVAYAFKAPVRPERAAAILEALVLPRGSVQHHRTQPGHKGARMALISACDAAGEIHRILYGSGGFHQRFEELLALRLDRWGRTTCYDLLVRTGMLSIGGQRYEPDRAYLAGSTGPGKGFAQVWGLQVTRGNAERGEQILRAWSRRWVETCARLGVSWEGAPYSPGDFENALCIYQEHRPVVRCYRASLNGVTATPQTKYLWRKGSTVEGLVTSLGEAL